MPEEFSFFDGMDILDGMPLRRAGAILFAIEGRTAQLVAQSRQALAPYRTEKTAAEKERAFLAAIARGRDLPLQPTIQDIERFAPEWASLVPSDDAQRAALAKQLGEKYRFRRQDVPVFRRGLGLDTEGVNQAYQRLFHQPVDSIYAASIPFPERNRWLTSRLASRLERMPPFWTAFSLTLTETVGASLLALPIALAGLGPIPGLILILILGLLNILTITGLVEAIARDGNMRYGTAYFGRLVGDYLGRPGSIVLAPALSLQAVLVSMAFYVGVSTSLADVTGVSPMVWSALLFLVAVYFLRRESLNATVASALVVGFVCILVIVVISILALPYVELANLRYVNLPFRSGQPFDPAILELVFGVGFAAYFGHTSVGRSAKVVLRRHPDGASLVWGNVAAMATAMALNSLFVFAVNGAIPSADLSSATGTALSPLAVKVGGIVPILGLIYVILAMGMGSLHYSASLFYQVREAFPAHAKPTVQFFGSLAPVFVLFAVVEWMLFTNTESFSGLLGIMGVLFIPILEGIFPMLMLVVSRRKGDYAPKLASRFLGSLPVMTMVYVIYLGSVFAYGLLIWQDPVRRLMAIGVGIAILIVTYLVFRQGAFARRLVIELKVEASDTDERATLALVDAGKPLVGTFRFAYAREECALEGSQVEIPSYRQLKRACVEFSSPSSKEVKVWIHRVTPEGRSEAIPAALHIRDGGADQAIQMDSRSSVIVPLTSQTGQLEISLATG